ncbi:hypothetical protein TRVL_01998 [Trypanosoma vivax]|nr:hypothetical protein TRVL_01998 [Trypanosoma vivax]
MSLVSQPSVLLRSACVSSPKSLPFSWPALRLALYLPSRLCSVAIPAACRFRIVLFLRSTPASLACKPLRCMCFPVRLRPCRVVLPFCWSCICFRSAALSFASAAACACAVSLRACMARRALSTWACASLRVLVSFSTAYSFCQALYCTFP